MHYWDEIVLVFLLHLIFGVQVNGMSCWLYSFHSLFSLESAGPHFSVGRKLARKRCFIQNKVFVK